jgi:hypothetical protein
VWADRIDLVFQLDDDALRTLATDAGHLAELHQVLSGNCPPQLLRREDREGGLSQLGSHSGSCEQEFEELPLVGRGKTVQRQRVFRTTSDVASVARCPSRNPATVLGLHTA